MSTIIGRRLRLIFFVVAVVPVSVSASVASVAASEASGSVSEFSGRVEWLHQGCEGTDTDEVFDTYTELRHVGCAATAAHMDDARLDGEITGYSLIRRPRLDDASAQGIALTWDWIVVSNAEGRWREVPRFRSIVGIEPQYLGAEGRRMVLVGEAAYDGLVAVVDERPAQTGERGLQAWSGYVVEVPMPPIAAPFSLD